MVSWPVIDDWDYRTTDARTHHCFAASGIE